MSERFTPTMWANYHLARAGMTVQDVRLPPVAVLAWGKDPILALAEEAGAKPSTFWPYAELLPLYEAEIRGHRVCFAAAPIGAPTTVMLMETMIVCGVRAFVGLGRAGSLQSLLPVGAFILPITCIREEGTSAHYIDADTAVRPSARLASALQKACEEEGARVASGTVWTIDAPFRELVSKIETYSREGALGVDMETSAMYALGMLRGVEVCNLLVVSDELWDEWWPGFHTSELQESEGRAREVILRCLSRGLEP